MVYNVLQPNTNAFNQVFINPDSCKVDNTWHMDDSFHNECDDVCKVVFAIA